MGEDDTLMWEPRLDLMCSCSVINNVEGPHLAIRAALLMAGSSHLCSVNVRNMENVSTFKVSQSSLIQVS